MKSLNKYGHLSLLHKAIFRVRGPYPLYLVILRPFCLLSQIIHLPLLIFRLGSIQIASLFWIRCSSSSESPFPIPFTSFLFCFAPSPSAPPLFFTFCRPFFLIFYLTLLLPPLLQFVSCFYYLSPCTAATSYLLVSLTAICHVSSPFSSSFFSGCMFITSSRG